MNDHIVMVSENRAEANHYRDVLQEAGFGYHVTVTETVEQVKDLLSVQSDRVVIWDEAFSTKEYGRKILSLRQQHPQTRFLMLASEGITADAAQRARDSLIETLCLKEDYAALIQAIEGVIE